MAAYTRLSLHTLLTFYFMLQEPDPERGETGLNGSHQEQVGSVPVYSQELAWFFEINVKIVQSTLQTLLAARTGFLSCHIYNIV